MNHKMIVRELIQNLPPKCALVMDNAAYHNVQVNRRPLMTTKNIWYKSGWPGTVSNGPKTNPQEPVSPSN